MPREEEHVRKGLGSATNAAGFGRPWPAETVRKEQVQR